MIGEASGIVPDRGLNILLRVSMNTLMNLNSAGLTQVNYNLAGNAQQAANTRLSADTPNGILAGSVVGVGVGTASGVVVACLNTSALYHPVGIAINNAVGYPFESSSGVGSGKCPYIHGSGTVFATDLYETADTAGAAVTYAPGDALYASRNGFLGKTVSAANVVVGVVLIPPSSSDPFMVVQMRL